MELNWTTFILEIINFLVLIWILKRFLYKPVLNVIAQRRNAIEAQSAEAQRLHKEAGSLKQQYQSRLTDWEQERQKARDALSQEMEQERARQLEALQTQLAQEREKEQAAEQRRRSEAIREIEHRALQHGTEFSSRLLKMAAGPELESRLVTLVIKELEGLDPHQIQLMQEGWGEQADTVEVCSAFFLPDEQKQQLQAIITKVTGKPSTLNYTESSELVAGLHITIGAWVLQANVRDELKGFAEFAHAAR